MGVASFRKLGNWPGSRTQIGRGHRFLLILIEMADKTCISLMGIYGIIQILTFFGINMVRRGERRNWQDKKWTCLRWLKKFHRLA